jgi:hypothetical protein
MRIEYGSGSTGAVMATAMMLGVAIIATSDVGNAAGPDTRWQVGATRRVHVSAVDRNGAPVKDLTQADLEIKVAGKTQPVVEVRPATEQLRVSVLVSDGGTGVFQSGISYFVQKLIDRAEFRFTSILIQPEQLGDYVSDVNGLRAAIGRIGPRGTSGGGSAQLLEAIRDATKDVSAREAMRPVIVVARVGRESASDLSARNVRADLQQSGAILFVVSTAGADRRPGSAAAGAGADPMAQARGQFMDSETEDRLANLASVLGDGPRETGGRHEQAVSGTMRAIFEGIADELLGQYDVTYAVPAGSKPTDKFSVGSKRRGMTVRAPTR